MPTPTELSLLQQLARNYLKLKNITQLRYATMGSAKVIEAAYTAELAAEAELATAAARIGVPVADAIASATTTAGSAAGTGAAVAGTAFGWPAILAGIAILGAVGSGVYMAKNWGRPSVEPVRFGAAAGLARPAARGNSTPDNIYLSGSFYIYAVNTSGWSFYIGEEKDVKNKPSRSFTDGGTSDQPIEFKKLVEKPFNSYVEARDYLKTRVTPGKQSYWTGTWKKFDGGEYRTVHVAGL